MDEITSIEDIHQLVVQGFKEWKRYGDVNVRVMDDLLIFNYNNNAVFTGRWNYFERVSRGLIINHKTGEIVARSFDKFYNWGQGGQVAKHSAHIVAVTDKLDGSLGVLFRHKGQFRIATRGAFESEQAQWATKYLNDYFDLTGLPNELTLLFEIIYPGNRIVVDYADREDLVLLAARNRYTGDYLPFFPTLYDIGQRYGFTLPQVYSFNDITQIIENTGVIDASREGYVVEFSDGSRFKFKGDRYIELQRLIMGLTFKNTLRALEHGTINDILNSVPDEFLNEVRGWISEIQARIASVTAQVQAAFDAAPKDSRKEFALWVNQHHPAISHYLFFMIEGRDILPLIYQREEWGNREETPRSLEDG